MTKETISRYLENGCKGHKNVVSSRELERALGISLSLIHIYAPTRP